MKGGTGDSDIPSSSNISEKVYAKVDSLGGSSRVLNCMCPDLAPFSMNVGIEFCF